MDSINKRIRELRTEANLTQIEFAEMLGVTQSGVSAMEQIGRNVSDLTIKSICNQFKINENWLRTGTLPKYAPTKDDCIAQISQILEGENEFAKTVFRMFANYSNEDWAALNHLISKLNNAEITSDTFYKMPQSDEALLDESTIDPSGKVV